LHPHQSESRCHSHSLLHRRQDTRKEQAWVPKGWEWVRWFRSHCLRGGGQSLELVLALALPLVLPLVPALVLA